MKINTRRYLNLLAVVVLAIAMAACSESEDGGNDNESDAPSVQGSVTIKRDNWGVPHVYADDIYGLFYGYGYALAVDRLFQMEMIKRSVLGTVSEVLGPEYVERDKDSRMNFDPRSIKRQLAALPEEDRNIFEGYAAGFNARIQEVLAAPESLMPKQFIDFGFEPSEWMAFDVTMLYVGTMAGRYSNSSSEIRNLALLNELKAELGDTAGRKMFDQIRWLEDPLAPTTVPRVAGLNSFAAKDSGDETAKQVVASREAASSLPRLAQGRPAVVQVNAEQPVQLAPVSEHVLVADSAWEAGWRGVVTPEQQPVASNLWIIGPNKTVDGSTILNNGPQFGWFNPAYTYSIGLHGAGYDVTGNTPFALPIILFGTNGTIAWGATAGPLDVNDYYQLQLSPADQYEYLYNGEYRPMEKRTEIIEVKGADEVTLDIYSSVHGTVTSFDLANNTAYAFKRSWAGYEIQSLMAWIHSMQAQNWKEWLAQAEKVATTINWYYADSSDNIGYVSPGYLPIRPESQDIRLPAIGDGSMEWQGIRPFSEVPKVYNPTQGYIVNWNNQPAPGEIAHGDGANWSVVDRVNEFIARIEAKPQLTRDEVWELLKLTSFADTNARYFLPYIAEATNSLTEADGAVYEAAQRLKTWDMLNTNSTDSDVYAEPAVTIFRTWLGLMIERVLEDDLPSIELSAGYPGEFQGGSVRPGNGSELLYNAFLGDDAGVPQTFDFFNGADKADKLAIVLEVLQETVADLTAEFGPDQSAWLTPVTKHRFVTNNFLGVPQANASEVLYLPTYMNRGTENHQVTFSHNGVSLCTVAPPGQSGFVAPDGTKSPHYKDQLELYENFECKTEWLTKAEVDAHAESVKTLSYSDDG